MVTIYHHDDKRVNPQRKVIYPVDHKNFLFVTKHVTFLKPSVWYLVYVPEKSVYIVRIYPAVKGGQSSFTGVVEKVGVKGEHVFHSGDELLAFLGIKGLRQEDSEAFPDRRRHRRMRLRIPVLVRGRDREGRAFAEETLSRDMSPGGINVPLKRLVNVDTELDVIIDPGRSSLGVQGKVVRVEESRWGEKSVAIGIAFACTL